LNLLQEVAKVIEHTCHIAGVNEGSQDRDGQVGLADPTWAHDQKATFDERILFDKPASNCLGPTKALRHDIETLQTVCLETFEGTRFVSSRDI
jgi:hypothetical protein